MYLHLMRWMYPLWEGEGASGGTGGEGGESGGTTTTTTTTTEQPVSLRAQMASQLSETEQPIFSKWAEGYKTDQEFLLGALNMRQQFDARVPVPKADSKPEEISKYFERVGKPADAKAYEYDFGKDDNGKPRELPDTDRARFEAFKVHAFENNYTQTQFKAGIDFIEKDIAAQETQSVEMLNRAQEDSVRELKKQWGPDYDANLAAAIDGGTAFAHDEKAWVDFVNLPITAPNGMQIKIGDHPTFLQAMAKVGRASSEDQRVRNLRQSGEAETIQAKIGEIEQEAIKAGKSTASEPYYSRLRALHQKLTPNKPMSGMGANGFG